MVDHTDIAFDCRYYLGDRPCIFNKKNGSFCFCDHYKKIEKKICIIKLDAMGDVLRTTCLLPAISRHWMDAGITWVTRKESVPLLKNNPYLLEVIPYGEDAVAQLSTRKFDAVINLDAGKISSGLASMTKANDKYGYILMEEGFVKGTNSNAEEWLRMGIFDDLKKLNKKTYQIHMLAILGLETDNMQYVFNLEVEEMEFGRHMLKNLGVDTNRPIVGIHTGGGGRWPMKQWREDGFVTLIREMKREFRDGIQILLFGGPSEREINTRIKNALDFQVFDAGCENEVRLFASLVGNCSVVVSGDTLAMHIALAMKRRVVTMFGPTSHTEIELFGLGEKILPVMECLCCYSTSCDFKPNCMDNISVDMVKNAIIRQLKYIS